MDYFFYSLHHPDNNRRLRCPRNSLHLHLFTSFIIRSSVFLVKILFFPLEKHASLALNAASLTVESSTIETSGTSFNRSMVWGSPSNSMDYLQLSSTSSFISTDVTSLSSHPIYPVNLLSSGNFPSLSSSVNATSGPSTSPTSPFDSSYYFPMENGSDDDNLESSVGIMHYVFLLQLFFVKG